MTRRAMPALARSAQGLPGYRLLARREQCRHKAVAPAAEQRGVLRRTRAPARKAELASAQAVRVPPLRAVQALGPPLRAVRARARALGPRAPPALRGRALRGRPARCRVRARFWRRATATARCRSAARTAATYSTSRRHTKGRRPRPSSSIFTETEELV